jgi:hypothetical protein
MTAQMEHRRHQRQRSRPALPADLAIRVGRHLLAIALFAVPAVVLWWHVWTGHPSSTITCPCGDPAQEVWFIAWPAWAIAHGANVFFSGAVNVPHGANLLSNTSGTLVGMVLSPVTWLWGPVTATNVALTLAPAASAWGCWVAIRPFLAWKPAAVPAALVFGYSSAIVSSIIFGHVSVTFLVVPPLLFTVLYESVVRQTRSPWRDGLLLALLVVVQFLISPEVLVMALLLTAVGMVVALAVGWRTVRARLGHAARALALGLGLSVALLAYPAWFGISGPQSVSGVLFAIAPLSGVLLSGFLSPGPYNQLANSYVRFGGYMGRNGPTPNYLGWGLVAAVALALAAARRRPLIWFMLVMAAVTSWLALGTFLLGGPKSIEHVWMPWRYLSELPVLKEILSDQFAPFIFLFLAFVLAIGIDACVQSMRSRWPVSGLRLRLLRAALLAGVSLAVLIPTFVTFDMPFTVRATAVPLWMRQDAPRLSSGSVLLTVPFAVSGSTAPMLWQAVDGMHFSLAGGGLKTPNAHGGPVGQGTPGSARAILSDLSIVGDPQPDGTTAQVMAVRAAVRSWHVTDVVIDGESPDPIYTSGFLTEVVGQAPSFVDHAWVWHLSAGGLTAAPALGASLYLCGLAAAHPDEQGDPLAMSACVLKAAALRHGAAV